MILSAGPDGSDLIRPGQATRAPAPKTRHPIAFTDTLRLAPLPART